MAVKGAKTKAEMVEKFAKLFGKDWIGEYNGKYYVWAMENGEKIQIAITLTCPKNLVETVSNSAQGKDFDFRISRLPLRIQLRHPPHLRPQRRRRKKWS